jgi:hypothetical protein
VRFPKRIKKSVGRSVAIVRMELIHVRGDVKDVDVGDVMSWWTGSMEWIARQNASCAMADAGPHRSKNAHYPDH